MTLFPDTPEDPLMPSVLFRWVRRVSAPNQFGIGYREKVLQQWHECAFEDSLHGEWRDVPVEEAP